MLPSAAPHPIQMNDIVDLCTPPPSPGRPAAAAPLREVDGVILLDSDEPAPGADKENTPARPDAAAAQPAVAKAAVLGASTGAPSAAGASSSSAGASSSSAGASSSSAAGPSSAGGALGKRPAPPVKEEGAPGKRKAVEPEPDDDDDEVMEQAAPANPVTTSAPAAADDDDDELQYQGHTGAIALADFPHARENCVTKPFRFGAEQQHCANCYCYVCDGDQKEANTAVHVRIIAHS